MTNILKALLNIKKYRSNVLNKIVVVNASGRQPRVNSVGDEFDSYVKDALCDSFDITDINKKLEIYNKYLSHLGSQNNPPDIMIRDGDAIEVKKVGGLGMNSIALNSSYPKQKLHSNDPMVTNDCKRCEKWDVKDFIYSVGNVDNGYIRIISFIYGDCYSAKKETYEKIKTFMINGIKKMGLDLSKTRELARINKLDPTKITDLRVRGMWQIKSPLSVFSGHIKFIPEKKMAVYAIMTRNKFNSFPKEDIKGVEKELSVKDITIVDPDNPEAELGAKLIHFSF